MKAGAAYANGVASGASVFGAFSCAGVEELASASTRAATASAIGRDRGVFIALILSVPNGTVGREGQMLRPGPCVVNLNGTGVDIMHGAMNTRATDALYTILPIAGWAPDRAREVQITDDVDPMLPTPFRIGETSAAALAAVGL